MSELIGIFKRKKRELIFVKGSTEAEVRKEKRDERFWKRKKQLF